MADENMGAAGAPQSPRTAARQAAWAAREEVLAGRRMGNLGPNNQRRVRNAGAAAARSAYAEVKAFLETEECAIVGQAEKEFLALALSQLSDAELASLSQSGGSLPKGTQNGGALGQSLVNFLRALCNKVRGTVSGAATSAAARLDAAAAATANATLEDISSGVIRGLPLTAATAAGSLILTGHSSVVISLAMTALKGINAILPGAATVSVSTYSGLAQWLPLAGAAAPVAGKLFTIFVCYRAVVITAKFLKDYTEARVRNARAFDYDGFLRALMLALYKGICTGAPVAASAAIAAARATPEALLAAPGAAIATGRGLAARAEATGRVLGARAAAAGRASADALVVVNSVVASAVANLLDEDEVVVHAVVDAALQAGGRNVGVGAGAGGAGAVEVAVGPDAVIAAGGAVGGAAAAAVPAGLDALALMAAAMPALEVLDENVGEYEGVPQHMIEEINARKSRKRKQAGGKRSKPKTRRNRKNRK